MNANEMVLRTDFRLNRIKVVSRLAKFVCLAVLTSLVGFFILRHLRSLSLSAGADVSFAVIQTALWISGWKLARLPHFHNRWRLALFLLIIQFGLWAWYWKTEEVLSLRSDGWQDLVLTLYTVTMWFWYWKLAQLFRRFEQGMIFATETIQGIKTLGLLCIVGWVLGTTRGLLPYPAPFSSMHPARPAGATLISHTTHTYYMGFFAFDFGTGINLGPFLIGIIIILIAWIMDEGRKIQEEQNLTV